MNKKIPMLITKINEYINNKELQKVLFNTYNDFELREFHDFQNDRVDSRTIKRGLSLIKNIFHFQIIVNKSIYLPGIWLFSIYPKDYSSKYKYPGTIIKISEYWKKIWFSKRIIYWNIIEKILKNDNKINFEVFDLGIFQIKDEETWRLNTIQSIEHKTKYLNTIIQNYLKLDELKVIHIEKYSKWGTSFSDIVKDYYKNRKYSLDWILKLFDIKNVWFHTKILEDILICIWYIENNKEKFNLK